MDKSKSKRKRKRPPTKQASGGARLMASGKRPVLLGLDPEHHRKISAAAAIEQRAVTQFLVYHGLAAAEKILQKNSKQA